MNFHDTGYGHKFFNIQLPSLIKNLGRLAGLGEKAMAEAEKQEAPHMDQSDFWRGIYENVVVNCYEKDFSEEEMVACTEYMVNNDWFSQNMNELIVEKLEDLETEREDKTSPEDLLLQARTIIDKAAGNTMLGLDSSDLVMELKNLFDSECIPPNPGGDSDE